MEYIIKHDEEHGDILIPKVEKILCAAIWYKDYFKPVHSCINIETGVVLCGYRHGHIIGQYLSMTGKTMSRCGEYVQGFLTNHNRFVDRFEGKKIFEESTGTKLEFEQLYSEDLY